MDSAVDGENIALTCDAEHFSASLLRAAMNAALHAHLGASAVVELRKPLDDALIAQIAAEGLNAPELSANRILEVQLHAAGFDD